MSIWRFEPDKSDSNLHIVILAARARARRTETNLNPGMSGGTPAGHSSGKPFEDQ